MKSCPECRVDPRFLAPEKRWHTVELVLPQEPPKPKGGRPREDDEKRCYAICQGVRTGIHWKALPRCTIEFSKPRILGDSKSCGRPRWWNRKSIKVSRGSGKGWMVR